jgi:hypothetical protein
VDTAKLVNFPASTFGRLVPQAKGLLLDRKQLGLHMQTWTTPAGKSQATGISRNSASCTDGP